MSKTKILQTSLNDVSSFWPDGDPGIAVAKKLEREENLSFKDNMLRLFKQFNLHFDVGKLVDSLLPHFDKVSDYPNEVTAFSEINKEKNHDKGVHFFIDDKHFNKFWVKPKEQLARLSKFKYVFTPDFSVFRGASLLLNGWQLYKSRHLGKILQQRGAKVIPTIPLLCSDLTRLATVGLEKGTVVAVSTLRKRRNPNARRIFQVNLDLLARILEPRIVVYGGYADFDFHGLAVKEYPHKPEFRPDANEKERRENGRGLRVA